jgi:hypothetical protein
MENPCQAILLQLQNNENWSKIKHDLEKVVKWLKYQDIPD